MTENRNRYAYQHGETVETQPEWFKRILSASITGPHPDGQILDVQFLITNEQALRLKGGK